MAKLRFHTGEPQDQNRLKVKPSKHKRLKRALYASLILNLILLLTFGLL